MADIRFEDVLELAKRLSPEEQNRLCARLKEKRIERPQFPYKYRVCSLEDMLQHIFPSDPYNDVSPETQFFTKDDASSYYYRGQADSSWGLVPSIFRGIQESVNDIQRETYLKAVCQMERKIYDDFTDQSRAYLPAWTDRNNRWEILCVAQHFGVPTRLLDWTSNFLAATYFAVCDEFDKDGAIWCLRGKEFGTGQNSSDVDNTNLRKMPFAALPTNPSFFVDHRNDESSSESYFALILPPHIENRIKNQSGVFSVHIALGEPTTLDELVYDHATYLTRTSPDVLLKFVIDQQCKRQIKARLEILGVDFSHLYPDLDGLGRYWADYKRRRYDWWEEYFNPSLKLYK